MKPEFESVIIYSSVLETIIRCAFSDGMYSGKRDDDYAQKYAKDKVEWVRRIISQGLIVRYDDINTETNTEEK